MSRCTETEYELLIERMLADEIDDPERDRLLTHAQGCSPCREYVELHHRLLDSELDLDLPTEQEFTAMRQAVLSGVGGAAAQGRPSLGHGLAELVRALVRQPALLDEEARTRLKEILANHAALGTVHDFRERLKTLWGGANVSNERLLEQLRQWCAEAEASGIKALEEFSERLRSYQLAPA